MKAWTLVQHIAEPLELPVAIGIDVAMAPPANTPESAVERRANEIIGRGFQSSVSNVTLRS